MTTPTDPHSLTPNAVNLVSSTATSFAQCRVTGKSTGVGEPRMSQAEAIDTLSHLVEENDWAAAALDRLIEDLIPTHDDGSWRDRNGL